jgi:UDP-N-acetyl-D-glucosamine/UDP-N-acetyl-D-galactosamine dehydrogenase
MIKLDDIKIAIVGLGYVGLPLAVKFGALRSVLGFDVSSKRLAELRKLIDSTLELSEHELSEAVNLTFTDDQKALSECNFFIVTVPTPIDSNKNPDLSALKLASMMIGKALSYGDVVVYESTVFPGATEEVCVPILEEYSGLRFNESFYCGYSPERINPGDKTHKISDIIKVTSGSTPGAADLIDSLYKQIIKAGTYRAESIKVAEAAKVIENTQRDLNIALMNELAIIFKKMNIDTESVLKAASTKWNFISYRPGLVGGHCIGVDPYYLTYKAQEIGYHPEITLSGRKLNDRMGVYAVDQLKDCMIEKGIPIAGARVLIMGLAFKENCPDIRNTKVVDLISGLVDSQCHVDVYDPWVDADCAREQYDILLSQDLINNIYDAVIIAVAHNEFEKMGEKNIRSLCKENSVIYDLKYILGKDASDLRL